MKQPTTKKKPMTLEDFAAAVHQDYLDIRKDLATTKSDIREIRTNMATKSELYELSQKMVTREEFRSLQSDVKMITDSMVSKADLEALRDELLNEMRNGKPMEEVREHLHIVEKKLGIKPTRRAA